MFYTCVCVCVCVCWNYLLSLTGVNEKLPVRAVNSNGICICFREQQRNIQYKKYSVLRSIILMDTDMKDVSSSATDGHDNL